MEEKINQRWSLKGSAILKTILLILFLGAVLACAYGASVSYAAYVLNARLTGKIAVLHDLYSEVGSHDAKAVCQRALEGSRYETSKANDRSNFIYEVQNKDGKILDCSNPEVSINPEDPLTIQYWITYSNVIGGTYYGGIIYSEYAPDVIRQDENSYRVLMYIDVARGFFDRYSVINTFVTHVCDYGFSASLLTAGGLVALIILLVALCGMAGRYGIYGEVKDNILSKVWLEVIIAAFGFIALTLLIIGRRLSSHTVMIIPYLIGTGLVIALLGILFIMNLAHRIKLGHFWRRTFVGIVFIWCGKLFTFVARSTCHLVKKLGIMWRTAIAAFILIAVALLHVAITGGSRNGIIFAGVMCAIYVIGFMFVSSYMLLKLEKGIDNLAEGNFSEEADTKHLFPTFRRAAEKINIASKGLNKAVEERIKSERMRTELITNVSHDIKTPLTSIINYSELICSEQVDNEKVTEYATVLHRQGERLKRLLEDLLEASKASTGNLEVVLGSCALNVLVAQVAAEYEQKFEDAGLTLISEIPGDDVYVMADGRRLSRVLDNLLNNACKYSLKGTRVYVTVEENQEFGRIIIKNTSSAKLNVTPDELMERFVRGDESRNTEGSGLGLSIAQSLTELQGGKLALSIDGDLFKAIVCMNKA